MKRAVLSVVMIASTTACASAGAEAGVSSGPASTRIITSGSGADIEFGADAPAAARVVSMPPDQVWAALPAVYETLDITGGSADSASRTYSARDLRVRRRLGDQPLSRYLSCGNTSAGAPVAVMYRIQLSVTTSVQPAAGGGSRIQTEVSASGQSTEGTSNNRVRCGSTGALEARIAELLGARTQR
jgi:hypothetical protein